MRVLLRSFHLSGHTVEFHSADSNVRTTNKQHHKKVLLCRFYFKGDTLGFHLQIEKLKPLCTA